MIINYIDPYYLIYSAFCESKNQAIHSILARLQLPLLLQ